MRVITFREVSRVVPAQLDLAAERLRKRAICRTREGLGHRINFGGEHVRPAEKGVI